MAGKSRTAEEKIAWIASGANGAVSREELLRAGLTRHEIERRLEKGLLIREFPGVYRVGHRAPNPLAFYSAAVKACGQGAVLAYFAAAWLLGLIRGEAPPPEVITRTPREIEGLVTRCCRRLNPRETSALNDIPVTTVPRTLSDLAPRMTVADLARLFHEASVKYRVKPEQVPLRGRPGAAKLRAVMYGDAPVLLSEAERVLYERLRAAGVPLPHTNVRVENRYLDLRWPGLTVEIDSYRYHGTRHAWEKDHRRRREARRRQEDFLAFTAGDVLERLDEVIAELHEAISLASRRA